MSFSPPPMRTVFIATLGGQPQVVTLALDALLARGERIGEVVVVHFSPQTPRYQDALARLAAEFVGERYQGQPCRFRPLPVQLRGRTIDDLSSETAADAVADTFHHLLRQLKQQDVTIHLCATGGRRLLGMLALSAALLHFDTADRIWHLYSSDAVRAQTDRGERMHLPPCPDVQLVRVPIPPWGHYFAALRVPPDAGAETALTLQARAADAGEHGRCRQVVEALTLRQRDVLRAFAQGKQPQAVAEALSLSIATIDSHKTTIYAECRNVWALPPDARLDYRWLRDKFGPYFEATT